ncbi:response regulator transcription factor [Azospirillum agricola]|uniref:response regulator transcription factor n=1 Tax=Azospirillum agricola TaxID=1720247 RepID=UPI000A0F2253|nr:response regulator transcription factor [Azospirillum agricola]SMH47385.1 DNA-binding response regulator, NarL/FixJ family, contains REC and HTH domains [Azospirillum lipoferum]
MQSDRRVLEPPGPPGGRVPAMADHAEGSAYGLPVRPGARSIRALLLDGTPLTRESLSMSLNLCDGGLHVATAATEAEAEAVIGAAPPPDVVLCNLSGTAPDDPEIRGLLERLLGRLGAIPLIVLAEYEDTADALALFRLGARGYIATNLGLSVAVEAVRLVGNGGTFIPPAFLGRLMQDPLPGFPPGGGAVAPSGDEAPPGDLTPRQIAVLSCLREGKANKIIAHELGMRESTVKVHVRNILRKLGATNRTQAVYLTFNRPSG